MNTDKVYAEQLANEYAPKDSSKVVALRKLDARAKRPAGIFTYKSALCKPGRAARTKAGASHAMLPLFHSPV